MNLFETVESTSDACISPCGRYRYWLTRRWSDAPLLAWVMLNPSTADASQDDPTIRRCMGFARGWGYGGIVVVNLFAFRATKPDDVWSEGAAAVGPDNDRHILEQTRDRRVIAAWGTLGNTYRRDSHVMRLLAGRDVHHIGLTKDGHPRHPLYVPGGAVPSRYIAVPAADAASAAAAGREGRP